MLLLGPTACPRLGRNQPQTPHSKRQGFLGLEEGIRQSKVVRTLNGHCRVGDIVIFDVPGPRLAARVPWKRLSVKMHAE
jgi:hypothetical protein